MRLNPYAVIIGCLAISAVCAGYLMQLMVVGQ